MLKSMVPSPRIIPDYESIDLYTGLGSPEVPPGKKEYLGLLLDGKTSYNRMEYEQTVENRLVNIDQMTVVESEVLSNYDPHDLKNLFSPDGEVHSDDDLDISYY